MPRFQAVLNIDIDAPDAEAAARIVDDVVAPHRLPLTATLDRYEIWTDPDEGEDNNLVIERDFA